MTSRPNGPRRGGLTVRMGVLAGAFVLLTCGVALSATASGSSPLTNRAAVYAPSPFAWSNPIQLDPSGSGALDSVSCPASNKCIAVDGAGYEVAFNPASPGSDGDSGRQQHLRRLLLLSRVRGLLSANHAVYGGG
jgi:hypothetical protein